MVRHQNKRKKNGRINHPSVFFLLIQLLVATVTDVVRLPGPVSIPLSRKQLIWYNGSLLNKYCFAR